MHSTLEDLANQLAFVVASDFSAGSLYVPIMLKDHELYLNVFCAKSTSSVISLIGYEGDFQAKYETRGSLGSTSLLCFEQTVHKLAVVIDIGHR